MPDSELVIVARITAKPGHAPDLRAELIKLIEPSRQDPGCLQYDLHQSREHPETFLFYERWTAHELWEAHMNTPHLNSFRAAAEPFLKELDLLQMDHVPPSIGE